MKQLCVYLYLWHQQFSSKVWLGKENLNYFKVVLSIWCFWEGFPNRHLHVIGKWGVGSLGTVHIYICMLKGLRVPWDLFEQENLVTLGRTMLLVKGTASVFFSSQTIYPLVALGQITPRSAQFQGFFCMVMRKALFQDALSLCYWVRINFSGSFFFFPFEFTYLLMKTIHSGSDIPKVDWCQLFLWFC